MEKVNIIGLSGILAVARDDFKVKYKALKKGLEAELKANVDRYRGSDYGKVKDQEEKEKFERSVQALRKETREFVKPYFEDMREDEYAKVQKIDTATLEKLKVLSDLPLSAAELGVLQQRFAPKGNEYWEMRVLAEMAEKNGLNPMQYLNSATLDTKLDILSQEEAQLEQLLAEYNGEFKYGTEVLLSDQILIRAEKVYTNGWANSDMEDAEVARRAFLQLKGKSPVEQGIGLINVFRNATESVKEALFYEIAKDDSIIDSVALRYAGMEKEFEAFKSGSYEAYTSARDGMQKVMVATSKEEVASVAESLGENKYFNMMLKNATEKNIYVSDYFLGEQAENIIEL